MNPKYCCEVEPEDVPDLVAVVRCKNCQHQDDLRYEVGGKFVCRKGHGWNTDSFFCADGEPKNS